MILMMCARPPKQGSHSHGKSWKKLSWKVMEKSWNMKISQKVMELLLLMAVAAF